MLIVAFDGKRHDRGEGLIKWALEMTKISASVTHYSTDSDHGVTVLFVAFPMDGDEDKLRNFLYENGHTYGWRFVNEPMDDRPMYGMHILGERTPVTYEAQ